MYNKRPIVVYELWKANSITKDTNESTVAVDLREIAQDGVFALKYTITGDGTLTLEYTGCETKDGTFVEPSGASDIATGLTKTSGTSGTDIITFEPELMPFMKIKATETVTTDDAVLTLHLFIQ